MTLAAANVRPQRRRRGSDSRRCASSTSPRRSAPARCSTTSRSRSRPAAASSCSAAAAPARASRSGTSSAWCGRTAARCSSRATRSARWPAGPVAGAAVDGLPVPERRAVRLDLGRRERGVPAAPAHRLADAEIREPGAAEAGRGRPREGLRQDARRPLGRHAQARRPGARDGARPADPAGRRAERRARPDHLRRDRRAAARAQTEGRHHPHRRHPQHPERAAPRRRARHAARRADPGARHRRTSSIAATTRWCAPSCSRDTPVDMANTRLAAVGAFVLGGVAAVQPSACS